MKKSKIKMVSLKEYFINYYSDEKQNVSDIKDIILAYCKAIEEPIPDDKELFEKLNQIDNNLLNLIFNAAEQYGYDKF